MPEISEHKLNCPSCGEPISVLVDDSLPEQQYVEDCQVCCRPIILTVTVGAGGDIDITAHSENE